MKRKTVAFFDFTCCEGCQLQVANFGEELLDIMEAIDVVMFREVMSEKSDEYELLGRTQTRLQPRLTRLDRGHESGEAVDRIV